MRPVDRTKKEDKIAEGKGMVWFDENTEILFASHGKGASIDKVDMKRVKDLLLRKFDDSLGLIVIGSYAEGSVSEGSDLDIVWIKSRKIPYDKISALQNELGDKIQLIVFSRRQLNYHFKNSTTMAHSIKKGIILFDKAKLLAKLIKRDLDLPSREWMNRWFNHWLMFYRFGIMDRRRNRRFHRKYCRRRCYCEVGDYFARATVNFSILYLETKGIVPTTKREIWENCKKLLPRRLLKGLKVSFKVYHQRRNLRSAEAEEVYQTASWLRRRLKSEGIKEEVGEA